MVKMIVLDVDGVIVGHKPGINFPYPAPRIISALSKVRKSGIPVVLCSGKYHSAIEPVILKAGLNNPHITNNGTLIIDPLNNKPPLPIMLDKELALQIIKTCLKNNLHSEFFSINDYFMEKTSHPEVVERRTKIMQKGPVLIDSLLKEAEKQEVLRITAIAFNKQEKQKIEDALSKFKDQTTFTWTTNPSTHPWEYLMITAKTASKPHGLKMVAEDLGISLSDVLGVGDTSGDWGFMKLCGFVATMNDAEDELKALVKSKEEGKFFIAPPVDDDGILQVLTYFLR